MSRHHEVPSGPHPEHPFTVHTGLIAVVGQGTCIRVPPGATWPGLRALPDWMEDRVRPFETEVTPETTFTEHVTPRDLESGVALVHAQLLCTGTIPERLAVLARTFHPRALNQSTAGHLIGASRESTGDAVRLYYSRLPPALASRLRPSRW